MTNREFLVTLLQSHEFIKNSIHTTFIDNNLDLLTGIHKDQRSKIEKNFILSAISLLSLTQNYDSRAKHSVWNEIGHWRLIPEISIKMNGATHSIKYEVIESGKSYRTGIDGEWLDATILNSLDGYYRININGIQLNCWAAVNQSEINIDLYQHTFSARRTDIPDSRYIGKSTSPENRIEAKEITAPLNGRIVKINVVENESVRIGDTLLVIESMKMENKITAPRDAEIENIHVNVGELVELNKLLITLN
jgi:acetyl/propionyl-CoA carboxylase alpha subunit